MEYLCEEVMERAVSTIELNCYEFQHRIFIVDLKESYRLVGIKIMKELFDKTSQEGNINSKITADMILGIYKEGKINNEDIKICFFPLENSEKNFIFNKMKRDCHIEIEFPFLKESNREWTISWKDVYAHDFKNMTPEELIKSLSNTERHLREFTKKILKAYDMKGFVIFDPACSTGEFLGFVKKNFKDVYTIGHDMDADMIELARKLVDECACYNAAETLVKDESVDVLALRFLNYAVVTAAEAKHLFEKLVNVVKRDGYVVCFGHTPVLLNADYFEERGLKVLCTCGYDETSDSIFQFYLLKK